MENISKTIIHYSSTWFENRNWGNRTLRLCGEALLREIQNARSSNLARRWDILTEALPDFPQSPQANVGVIPPPQFPSTFFEFVIH
jgi:hypothetical protein